MAERRSLLLTNATISEERWDAGNQRMIYRVEYDDDVLRDEQGYPAFEGLEAIMQERKERLIALQQFHAQILAAHLKHLQTGDYTALGIAAQDALLELERRES